MPWLLDQAMNDGVEQVWTDSVQPVRKSSVSRKAKFITSLILYKVKAEKEGAQLKPYYSDLRMEIG